MATGRLIFAAICTCAAACMPPVPDASTPAHGPKDGSMSADMAPVGPGKSDSPTCGAQTFAVSLSSLPPYVYFVVDRSGSMADSFGAGQTSTKWDAAQMAMNSLLSQHNGKASWGLSLFPPNPSVDVCGKASVDVPMQLGDENAILSRINALTNQAINSPRGATPTADALKTVRDSAGLSALDRNNYVVLLTDGIPVCNDPADVSAVIDEMYHRSPSVKTFVIGIGSETASNPALLNAWAEKGGSARTGASTEYYQANDTTQLVDAFGAVIGEAASCTFRLQDAPPDPTLVVGRLDGVESAQDHANGYTYDPVNQSVVFHGTACDRISQGKVAKVEIIYGCPPAQIL